MGLSAVEDLGQVKPGWLGSQGKVIGMVKCGRPGLPGCVEQRSWAALVPDS